MPQTLSTVCNSVLVVCLIETFKPTKIPQECSMLTLSEVPGIVKGRLSHDSGTQAT